METTWTAVISIVSALSGVLIAWLTFGRNKSKDAADEGKNQGILFTDIGYIKAGIDDIKRKQEKQEAQNMEFNNRLNNVENDVGTLKSRFEDHVGAHGKV